jgi:hypothetical protein
MRDAVPTPLKVTMSAWTVLFAVATVGAVVVLSLILGISTLLALLVVTAIRTAFALASIWVPQQHRVPRGNGPADASSGDRFPRRPRPSSPSRVDRRPLPGA